MMESYIPIRLHRCATWSWEHWSILNPGPDFIYLSPGPDFIKLVRVRILSILSPGPDRIKAVRKASPDPDFINFWVRVRILSIESGSGSGFYQACPGPRPGPDSTNTLQGPYKVKTFKNLLLRNQEVDDIETWYTASGTQVRPNLFKWWHWFDLDNFYDMVKFVS